MVTDALDQKPNVLTWSNPKRIAASIKHSVVVTNPNPSKSFQSAMNMLSFYINRSGRSLPANKKRVLEQTKFELRKLFNR